MFKRKISSRIHRGRGYAQSNRSKYSIDSDLTAFPFESRELYPFGLTTIVPLYGAGKRLVRLF